MESLADEIPEGNAVLFRQSLCDLDFGGQLQADEYIPDSAAGALLFKSGHLQALFGNDAVRD